MNTGDNIIQNNFRDLEHRLNKIKEHFYLNSINLEPGELLNDRQQDHVRAYIALCHAEFESYLEQWSNCIVDECLRLWVDIKKPTLPLLSLFAHFEYINQNIDTNQKVHMIISRFKQNVIDENHGIKEKNIRKLFVPLGIDFDLVDTAWISTLDSYGAKRGETVHTSARVQEPLDISTVINNVEIVKEGIKDFELLLNGLL